MADRIAVINHGEIILVEEKTELMRKLGKKQLTLQLQQPLAARPRRARELRARAARGRPRAHLHVRHEERANRDRRRCSRRSAKPASDFKDLQTTQSSLEEIFVSLVSKRSAA